MAHTAEPQGAHGRGTHREAELGGEGGSGCVQHDAIAIRTHTIHEACYLRVRPLWLLPQMEPLQQSVPKQGINNRVLIWCGGGRRDEHQHQTTTEQAAENAPSASSFDIQACLCCREESHDLCTEVTRKMLLLLIHLQFSRDSSDP